MISELEVANGINAALGSFRKTHNAAQLDDLRQTGLLAVLIAAQREAVEVTHTYVRLRGGGAIKNEVKKESLRRARYVGSDDLPPGSLYRVGSRDGTDADIRLWQLRHILEEAMKSLSELERNLLDFRYVQGLEGLDLATKLGTDEPHISKIHRRALKKLKKILSARNVNAVTDAI